MTRRKDRQTIMDDGDGVDLLARLGVMAAGLLEEAHTLCADSEALGASETPQALLSLADDFRDLAKAMEVVVRRDA